MNDNWKERFERLKQEHIDTITRNEEKQQRIDKAISFIYLLKNNVKDFETEYKEDMLNMLDDIGNILGGDSDGM